VVFKLLNPRRVGSISLLFNNRTSIVRMSPSVYPPPLLQSHHFTTTALPLCSSCLADPVCAAPLRPLSCLRVQLCMLLLYPRRPLLHVSAPFFNASACFAQDYIVARTLPDDFPHPVPSAALTYLAQYTLGFILCSGLSYANSFIFLDEKIKTAEPFHEKKLHKCKTLYPAPKNPVRSPHTQQLRLRHRQRQFNRLPRSLRTELTRPKV